MGLFDKKKGKSNSKDNTQAKSSMMEEAKESQAVGDRFMFVAEEATKMLDGNGVVVTGNVHGTATADSKVYIINIGNKITEANLVQVEGKDAEGNLVNGKVTDSKAQLQLSSQSTIVIQKFTVITSVRPQTQIDVGEAAENPYCSALMYEIAPNNQDRDFFGCLTYALCHSHFISPMRFSEEPVVGEDGKAVFEKDTQMGFYMFKAPEGLERGEKEDFVLPVFTDWSELHKFKEVAESKTQVRTMIMTFQNILSIINNPQCAGFVVNPFSKNTVTVNRKLINTIISSSGYQNEFGEKKGESDVSEVKVPKDTNCKIGIPAESDEVKNIRSELATYGKLHDDVKSISFMLKMDEDNTQKYLIILGVTPDVAKDHMQGIFEAIKGYAGKCAGVEFAIAGQNKGIDDIAMKLAEHALVYSAFTINN